ncbi:hypothetical protein LCGC14_2356430 [marine sediment metagenome]|uniref:Uncharacterized protein n=1 Tax=marine sediment metagenome TaxID=412755 RepID=A0A0F9F2R0_9ZZZZ
MEERMKSLEIELAYLTKAIEELKKVRVVEIHTHFTNHHEGYPEDYQNEEYPDD